MNFPTTPGGDGAERPAVLLQLRLVHSRGKACNGRLVVPPGGLGMADAVELGGERLSEGQWRAANLCRVAWQSGDKSWYLVNNSHTLVCALNGERVTGGRPLAIAPGDSLELGLLRFIVEAEEQPRPAVSHDEPPSPPPAPSRGKATAALLSDNDAEAAFDLRDLALASEGSQHASVLDGPFGVLDIAGAEARPVADPLAQLLGESALPEPATPFGGHVDPLDSTPYELERVQQGRVSAVTQRLPTQDSSGANPAGALFDELHDEYVRVVGDPAQLAGRIDWEGFLAPVGEPAPTIEDLSRKAEPYPLLRDILQPREHIDRIIENFDPLGRSSLLDEEPLDDVLRLFAAGLARNSRALVPSLTRREHHELSPDSYMHIGSSRRDEKDGSQ
jgi:hypothetical protein